MLSTAELHATSDSCPSVRPEHLPVGALVNGRYRVEEILGAGGMGVVYRASDELNDGRCIALKTMCARGMRPEKLSLFKAEFQTMTKLRHPNVAEVYDFEAIHGRHDYFFTMEYVAGIDLNQATHGKSLNSVLPLIVQVCRALSYMHRRQVIHFDLKPSNVLVVPSDGRVKVLDFGLAGARLSIHGARVVGTPAYMAPEVIDLAAADHRADLYSLGITLYEILCRRRPFDAHSLIGLLRQHSYDPIVFGGEERRSIPLWLRNLIERLCAKAPADRIRSASTVIAAIKKGTGAFYELETEATKDCYILSPRFVGREREFERVAGFTSSRTAAEGVSCPALWVGGESGVGKSRLIREVRYHTQLRRVAFIESRCYEGALDEFGPIVRVLEHLVALLEAVEAGELVERYGSELVKVYPELAQKYDVTASPPINEPKAEQLRIITQVGEFLAQAGFWIPYVLYIDDIQWARPGTVDVLEYLCRALEVPETTGNQPLIAILGSFRDDEIDGRPIQRLVSAARHGDQSSVMHLEPLTEVHVGELVASMLGTSSLPDAFVGRLGRESAGNPFFVEELMRTLVANRSVGIRDGEWAVAREIGDLVIPESIAAVFLRRAGLLDEQQRRVIDHMAVAAQPVSMKVLEECTRLDAGSLHRVLGVLRHRRIVECMSTDELRFGLTHDRMRETLYAELGESKRQQLHLRLARAIEHVCGDRPDAHLYELAHHYWLSDDRDSAFRFTLLAARKAKETFANDLGAQLYRRALELLPTQGADPTLKLELLEHLGDLCSLTGRFDEARACLVEVCDATPNVLDKARLKRKVGNAFLYEGRLLTGADHLWEATQLIGHARYRTRLAQSVALLLVLTVHLAHRAFPIIVRLRSARLDRSNAAELIVAYLKLAYVYFWLDQRLFAYCTIRAANLADQLGRSGEAAHAYALMGGCFYGVLGRRGGLMRYGQRAMDMAEELDSRWHQGVAHLYHSIGLLHIGQYQATIDRASVARRLLQNCGDMFELGNSYVQLYYGLRYQGRMQEALAVVQEGLMVLRRAGTSHFVRVLPSAAGQASACLGRTAEALQQFDLTIEQSREAGDLLTLSAATKSKGCLLLMRGEPDRAVASLEEARAAMEALGRLSDYNRDCYWLLCRAYLEQLESQQQTSDTRGCSVAQVSRLVRKCLRIGKRHPNHLAPAILNKAIFEWYRGRRQLAKESFDRAIEVARDLGAGWQLTDACLETGRHLLEEPPQRSLAREYLEESRTLAEELGLAHYARRAGVLLEGEDSDEPPDTVRATMRSPDRS